MRRCVLDSWALVAFFKNEPAADAVDAALISAAEGKSTLHLSLVNWGEIATAFERTGGVAVADAVLAEIDNLPIEVVPPSRELTRLAARYKARGGLSYADCFAAALAKERKAELLTGDPEFKVLAREIKIGWLK